MFEEEVSEKLEQLAQQQTHEQMLSEIVAQQVSQLSQQQEGSLLQQIHESDDRQEKQDEEQEQDTETHRITAEVTVHGEEKDDNLPQWLNFTFKKKEKVVLLNSTLQQAIIESPRRAKRAKTIHHLSRTDSRDVIASIATPVPDSEGQPHVTPRYQVLEVNLGKQTKWGEIATLVAATSTVQTRMEKDHKTKAEVKAQLRQYKQLIMEIAKPLDSKVDDTLSSTSSLPQGDLKALYGMRKVAATIKRWAQD